MMIKDQEFFKDLKRLKDSRDLGNKADEKELISKIINAFNQGETTCIEAILNFKYHKYLSKDRLMGLIRELVENKESYHLVPYILNRIFSEFGYSLYSFNEVDVRYLLNRLEHYFFNKHLLFLENNCLDIIDYRFNWASFEGLEKLQNLKVIVIIHNENKELPEYLGNIESLEEIEIYDTFLTSIPDSFRNLLNLRRLSLECNQLEIFPNSIEGLQSLQILEMGANAIKSLPNWIENLKSLQLLNLANNKITEIPKSIKNIKTLQTLNLSKNPLDSKSEAIIQELKKNGVEVII